jgi:hypothetical protein
VREQPALLAAAAVRASLRRGGAVGVVGSGWRGTACLPLPLHLLVHLFGRLTGADNHLRAVQAEPVRRAVAVRLLDTSGDDVRQVVSLGRGVVLDVLSQRCLPRFLLRNNREGCSQGHLGLGAGYVSGGQADRQNSKVLTVARLSAALRSLAHATLLAAIAAALAGTGVHPAERLKADRPGWAASPRASCLFSEDEQPHPLPQAA